MVLTPLLSRQSKTALLRVCDSMVSPVTGEVTPQKTAQFVRLSEHIMKILERRQRALAGGV